MPIDSFTALFNRHLFPRRKSAPQFQVQTRVVKTFGVTTILTSGLLLVSGPAITPAEAACVTAGNSTSCLATADTGANASLTSAAGLNTLLINTSVITGPINRTANGAGNEILVGIQGSSILNGGAGIGLELVTKTGDINATNLAFTDINGSSGIEASVQGGKGSVNISTLGSGTISGANGVGDGGIAAIALGTGKVTINAAGSGLIKGGLAIGALTDSGDIDIKATGPLQGTEAVLGAGVFALSFTGNVKIETKGTVTSVGIAGIFATTAGAITVDAKDTVAGTGTADGINTQGVDVATNITTAKAVTSTGGDGIEVDSAKGAISITTSDTVTGTGGDGISGISTGTGTVFVSTAAGKTVTGGVGDGIYAESGGSNVAVDAKGITKGQDSGIDARTTGIGTIVVDAGGAVTGINSDGVFTSAGKGQTDIIGNNAITGDTSGVDASSTKGNINITTAAGFTTEGVTSGDGIVAVSTISGNIDVKAKGITKGADDGIDLATKDIGTLSVVADEAVTGQSAVGIITVAEIGQTDITSKNAVTGDVSGIDASSTKGNINITTAAGFTTEGVTSGDGIRAISSIFGNIDVKAKGITKGADDGIDSRTKGAGKVTVLAEDDVTGKNGNGINTVAETGITDITAKKIVSGNSDGIAARATSGEIIIKTEGNVTGTNDDGIDAVASLASKITISTKAGQTVEGKGDDGITGRSQGGDVKVAAAGTTIGASDGIDARTILAGKIDVTSDAEVTGTTGNGIFTSAVTGPTTIIANAKVTGGDDGIDAGSSTTGSIDVTTNDDVTGGDDGIVTDTFGGNINITTKAGKTVEGLGDRGIAANSGGGAAGGNINIQANGDTKGKNIGIAAFADKNATIDVTATSFVTGANSDGIQTDAETGKTTILAKSTVFGGADGIEAASSTGEIFVTAEGNVTGSGGNGIVADASAAGKVTVTTTALKIVQGKFDGIFAESGGADVTVNSNAGVVGFGGDAIEAHTTKGLVTVTVASNSTAQGNAGFGVNARSDLGSTKVTNDGVLYGSSAGANLQGTVANTLINNNWISNLSASAPSPAGQSDLAIQAGGAATSITNNGRITGRVNTSAFADTFTNTFDWITNGTSDFGAGADTLTNANNGFIYIGDQTGVAELTTFANLENFNNSGLILANDQSLGDGSNISDIISTSGNYTGAGANARLSGDAFLGAPGSLADELRVGGNTAGSTTLSVTDTNAGPGAYNPDGIVVVRVGGTTDPSHFTLGGGKIDKGLFFYDLVLDDVNKTHELAGLPDREAFETLAAVESAQNNWHEGENAWVGRQESLRDDNAKRQTVTAVADPPTMEAPADNGLWMALTGSWTDRDNTSTLTHFNKSYAFDTGYKQNSLGATGGADFGTEVGTSTVLFGLLAGYQKSELKFKASPTTIDMESGSIGAYATVLNNGFFANAMVKADFGDMDYSAPTLAPFGTKDSANYTTIGGRGDIGYRFGSDNFFIEPVISGSIVNTSMDSFSIGGSTIAAGDDTQSLVGAGARFGMSSDMFTVAMSGRVWSDVGGDNSVSILSAGPALGLSDSAALSGTFGEVTGKIDLNMTASSKLFLAGNVKFNDNTVNTAVNGGFAFTW